jgi:hypothetical protein
VLIAVDSSSVFESRRKLKVERVQFIYTGKINIHVTKMRSVSYGWWLSAEGSSNYDP